MILIASVVLSLKNLTFCALYCREGFKTNIYANLSDRITDQRSLGNLGNALQVEPHHVSSSIANNRHAVTEAAYNVLTIWFKNKESPFVAWEELSEALEKCEMKMWKYEVLERKEYESS